VPSGDERKSSGIGGKEMKDFCRKKRPRDFIVSAFFNWADDNWREQPYHPPNRLANYLEVPPKTRSVS
jgi:hypothetical protein